MSIQPPSDILLDVALAADPTTRAAATRRLSTSAGSDSTSFATTLDAIRVPAHATAGATSVPHAAKSAADTLPKAMTALEAFFLRTAFETMLPKASHVGGFAGAGAEVWKSMMAETLANTVAASGGLKLIRPARGTA